ncbi:hypothetical protein ABPG75_001053 [Micractinium tetrahymenae]
MLENQCTTWPMPLVATVHVPVSGSKVLGSTGKTAATLDALKGQLAAFSARMQKEGECQLQLALFTEEQAADNPDAVYPINALRNRGIQMAVTEARQIVGSLVILLLDIDFIVSEELTADLATAAGWEALMRRLQAGTAVALPAFETPYDVTGAWRLQSGAVEGGTAVAFQAAAGGKRAAVDLFHNGSLLVFKEKESDFMFGPTQYRRWMVTDDFYPISFKLGHEPFILMARALTPWYDERFTGYGCNKSPLLGCIFHWGGSFAVHPRGFVVHVPHERSPSFFAFRGDVEGRARRERELWEFYDQEVTKPLEAGRFLPVTSFPERCSAEEQQPRREEL